MNKTKLISVVYALIGLGTYTILEAAPANDPQLLVVVQLNLLVVWLN